MTKRISSPSGQPKRATSEIRPDAQLLDWLASSAPLALAGSCDPTVHGVVFGFCAAQVLWDVAIDGLHQY
jgi:hypothetical protein